jgi:tRNA dimethylallyltransferase
MVSGRTRQNKLVHLAGAPELVGRWSAPASTTPAVRAARDARGLTATPLLVIAGATATGKTGLAIEVASGLAGRGPRRDHLGRLAAGLSRPRHRDGEGDARGAARDPHHGSTSSTRRAVHGRRLRAHAPRRARGIAERGGLAILVGGTGLYLRAVARGIATTSCLRSRRPRPLEAEFLAVGLEPLVERLRTVAPRRAARSTPRTRDASSGRSRSRRSPAASRRSRAARLRRPGRLDRPRGRAGHAPRVDRARARAQFDAGLIDEARRLRERYDPRCQRSARSATARPGPSSTASSRGGRHRRGRPPQPGVREAPADLVPERARHHWLDVGGGPTGGRRCRTARSLVS